jgi:hypothetical protein
MPQRVFLLALSCGGVGAAIWLLVLGHAWLAARVLAADVLVVFAALMVL